MTELKTLNDLGSNAGLGDGKCVIEDFRFDASTQKKLIRKFVEDELCPCAIETFNAHDNRTIELTMDALYRAVINEMVLRGLSTEMAEAPNDQVTGRPLDAAGKSDELGENDGR